MRGVIIKKASVIAEDNRRKIISVLNGELNVKDIHILFMKSHSGDNGSNPFQKEEALQSQSGDSLVGKDTRIFVEQPLGNHKHWYPEVMYVLKGKCHYWLKNKEGETMECDLEEGDIMFRAPEVVHTCICTEDAILVDGSSESWINEDWNHVREVLK